MKNNVRLFLLFLIFSWQINGDDLDEIKRDDLYCVEFDDLSSSESGELFFDESEYLFFVKSDYSPSVKSDDLFSVKSDDLRPEFSHCKSDRRCVVVLVNDKNNKFVLKQNNINSFVSVIEKLGADIALAEGICANQVRIIPSNCLFIGKKEVSLPATLHTFVPGIQVRHLPEHLANYSVDLKQCIGKERKKKYGFRKELVRNISLHKDFPKIVALDTFLANPDRHRSNFFYDEAADDFFTIDFGSSLSRNLADAVYQSFLIMLNDENNVFSPEEIKGLEAYRDMLKKLIDTYSVKTLIEKFEELLEESLLLINEKDFSENLRRKEKIMKNIEANYNSCIKVADILDMLTQKSGQKEIAEDQNIAADQNIVEDQNIAADQNIVEDQNITADQNIVEDQNIAEDQNMLA